jgi:hypothetical protein
MNSGSPPEVQQIFLSGFALKCLRDHVALIDPAGLVTDCGGAEIVTMPTEESLKRFVEWGKQHIIWA